MDELRFMVGGGIVEFIVGKIVRFEIGAGFGCGNFDSFTDSVLPLKFIPRYAMTITTKRRYIFTWSKNLMNDLPNNPSGKNLL